MTEIFDSTNADTADQTPLTRAESLDTRLLRWARANGASRSPIILMLSAALREASNLAFWSEVDLMAVLPEPRFTSGTRTLRLVRFFTTVRNAVVFVPVALTWAAISVSTSSFGQYSQQNPATINFLAFWQDGYGYLPSFWRIGSVAQLDVAIILVIIGLTLLVGRLNHGLVQSENDWLDTADQERIGLAMEIQNWFRGFREVDETTVSEITVNAVVGLRDVTHEMREAMAQLQQAMTALGGTVPKVDGLTRDLMQMAADSTVAFASLTDTLRDGVGRASDVLHGMSQAVRELGNQAQDAASRVESVEQGLATAGGNLTSAVDAFADSATGLKAQLDTGLAAAIERSTNSIDSIVNEMAITGTSLKSSARVVQDQLEELQRSIERHGKR